MPNVEINREQALALLQGTSPQDTVSPTQASAASPSLLQSLGGIAQTLAPRAGIGPGIGTLPSTTGLNFNQLIQLEGLLAGQRGEQRQVLEQRGQGWVRRDERLVECDVLDLRIDPVYVGSVAGEHRPVVAGVVVPLHN